MFRNKTRVFQFFFLLAGVLLLVGAGCKNTPASLEAEKRGVSLALEYWGVWNDESQIEPILTAYKAIQPNVSIHYRKFRAEEFEGKLLEALAEDRGPDIVSLHNTWMKRYQSKLLPLPTTPLQMPRGKTEKQGVATVTTYTMTTVPVTNPRLIKDQFVPSVFSDVVVDNQVYGLPLSVDSMVLFYNRDLLAQSKITKAPSTWQEVLDVARAVTQVDKEGKITRSGVALGTSNNVPRFFDILSLLMMQTGTAMTSSDGTHATFQLSAQGSKESMGEGALQFYTSFANPSKESYTWSASLPDAVEMFAQGKLAMFFGYAYHAPQIKAKAPSLDIGYVPVPQLNPSYEVNYANYWVEAPMKKTKYPNEVWDFIQFATAEKQAELFMNESGRPPALRSLVDKIKNDPDRNAFGLAALTAQSWYHGKNPAAAEEVFKDVINQALEGKSSLKEILTAAAARMNQTL